MLNRLFNLSAAVVAYHVAGFPALLAIQARNRPTAVYPDLTDDELPTVSQLILARNEEAVIGAKIENSLTLDYPADKLQVIVVANGCTDGTADVIRSYADRDVVLAEYGEVGKTEAQRRAVHEFASGDFLVFSDANTPYDRNAIRELVKPFADPTVGSVCGNHVMENEADPRSQTEGLMWNLTERGLKTLESRSGGMIGANGSIYAVRRELFVDLPPDVYEDFWQPMMIAVNGHRTVYAPTAICRETVEEPDLQIEHRRKMRIVQQSVAGLINYRWVLNPIKYPRLSWLTVSHKVLRWLMPFFLLAMLLAATVNLVSGKANKIQTLYFLASTIVGFLAILGRGLGRLNTVPVLTHVYYAVLMLHAAFQGTVDGFKRGSFSSWDSAR